MFTDILIVSVLTNKAHLSTSKVFRSNCSFISLKRLTNTADKGVVLL